MLTKTRDNDYFLWLCSFVKIPGREIECGNFLRTLHEFDFYWILRNDENRAADGLELRNQFEYGYSNNRTTCSVLEMLIGVSLRMDFNMYNNEKGEQHWRWFWILIKNLGLHPFKNTDRFSYKKSKKNEMILKKFMDRDYSANGEGGLFPLQEENSDQRDVEIWYQMMSYLDENFGF